MSGPTGTSFISLPREEALARHREKFSPDLHTGTGNFTVPIALPLRVQRLHTQLNLVYSTGERQWAVWAGLESEYSWSNWNFRKGFRSMTIPVIMFILSGAEDLVPVEVSATRTRYRPRTEQGLFARIHHHHDATNNYWKVGE